MSQPKPDIMTSIQAAIQEAGQQAQEIKRIARLEWVNRPAYVGPDNKPVAFADRVQLHKTYLQNPALMENDWRNLQVRFPPPPADPNAAPEDVKFIPRRFIENGQQAYRDMKQAEKGAD